MNIYSWNVNGIRAVWNKGLFQKFITDHKPDIICLQETKAFKDQATVDLPDYKEIWNSADKKGYSGTAIFTKIKPLSITTGFLPGISDKFNVKPDKFGNPQSEGRVLSLEFKDFHLVTVYTPNSKGDLGRLELRHSQWDPAFLEHCKQLESTKPVVFCGDLNVAHKEEDLANPAQNIGKHGFTNQEREGIKNIIEAGFIDTFRMFTQGNGHYTWWTHWANSRARNIGWRIDYFLVSQSLKPKIKSAKIHQDVLGSDHCPVSIELDI